MRIERIQAAAYEKAALDVATSRLAYENQARLSEDINRRSAEQRQAALNMVQMAEASGGLNLDTLELDILISALEVRIDYSRVENVGLMLLSIRPKPQLMLSLRLVTLKRHVIQLCHRRHHRHLISTRPSTSRRTSVPCC